jgi:glycosyltransferase involved in cell wall biosynthesis
MPPRISVAVCIYNGEKYIQKQLDSILDQSTKPEEIVISDDGSFDKTLSIVQQYCKQHPSVIKLNRNDVNLGYIKNFEYTLSRCTGDLIFLSDQDDVWLKNKIETIIESFEQNKECDAVFHNLELINSESEPFEVDGTKNTIWDSVEFTNEIRNSLQKEDILSYILHFNNIATGAAMAFRKRAIQYVLPFQPEIPHDYQIALSLALNSKIYYLDCVLGYYRVHDTQQIGADIAPEETPRTTIRRFLQDENVTISPKDLTFYYNNLKRARTIQNIDIPDDILSSMESCFLRLKHKHLKSFSILQRKLKIANLIRPGEWDAKLVDLLI